MTLRLFLFSAAVGGIGIAAVAGLSAPLRADAAVAALPAPALDAAAKDGSAKDGAQTAIFAGGCFWGVQAVFQHVDGVTQAVSGYSGGSVTDPGYQRVSSGATGHAEAVRVTFDPARVSYATLLRIFFSVALDPTQVDRQGPDWGTQYRSELFVTSPDQERVARAYIAQLEAANVFTKPIATRVDPAGAFYVAEAYHQDYLQHHPDNGYIAANDIPKVEALQRLFPRNWRDVPTTVGPLAAR